MKTRTSMLTFAAALCLVGCRETDRPDPADVGRDVERAAEEVEESVQGAGQAARESAERAGEAIEREVGELDEELGKTRDQFVRGAREQLGELDDELEELEAETRKRGRSARADLRAMSRSLDVRLDEAEGAGAEAWQTTRKEIAEGLAELESSIDQARKELEPET